MNSQCFIHAGRAKYYINLGKEDYYTGGHDPRGEFCGSGADHFNLDRAKIEQQDTRLSHLMAGVTPDGEQEMRKGGRTYRYYKDKKTGKTKVSKPVCAIDNTFSAPKDVSLLWALAPEGELRNQIHEIHRNAVKEAVEFLDSKVQVRTNERRPDGRRNLQYHTAKGIFATFDHTTSRELDPQLHTHALLINAAVREDNGRFGAVCGKEVLKSRYIAGQIYQNHLRRELENQLGVETYDRPFSDEKGMSFGINGVTQEVKQGFSLRSMQIMKEIDATMTGAQVRATVLKTRRAKEDISPDQLFGEWQERGQAMGFDIKQVLGRNQEHTSPSFGAQLQKKVIQKVETQLKKFDAKDLQTDEQLLFRNVAKDLERKIEWKRNIQKEQEEKLREKSTREQLWIERKMREGLTQKEAEQHYNHYHGIVEQRPDFIGVDVTTFSREAVVRAFLKHDKNITGIQAEEYAEQFLEKYTNKKEKELTKKEKARYDQENKKNTAKNQPQNTPPSRQNQEKKYVYSLTYEGRGLAKQTTTREDLINTISSVVQWRKEINYALKDKSYRLREKAFDRKLFFLHATGKIDKRKYLQLRDQKYLEYSKFKLVTLQIFGVLSAKQVRYAEKMKHQQSSPYHLVNQMQREGRITQEEAKQLRIQVFQEQKRNAQEEKAAQHERSIEAMQHNRKGNQKDARARSRER